MLRKKKRIRVAAVAATLCALMMALSPRTMAADAGSVLLLPSSVVNGEMRFDPQGDKLLYEYRSGGKHVLRFVCAFRDARGRIVRSVKKDDLTFMIDGRPLTGANAEVQCARTYFGESPAVYAIILDASTSMAGVPLHESKNAAKELVQNAVPDDRFVVIRTAVTSERLCPPTAERSVVLSAVDAVDVDRTGRGTRLLDAISNAVGVLPAKAEEKAVVVFTDGRDEGSVTDAARVIEDLRLSNTPVFFVLTAQVKPEESLARHLAEASGGKCLRMDRLAPEHLIRQIEDVIAPHMAVRLVTTAFAADGEKHVLQVVARGPFGVLASSPTPFVASMAPQTFWASLPFLLLPAVLALVLIVAVIAIILGWGRQKQRGLAPVPSSGLVVSAQAASSCPICDAPLDDPGRCPYCGWTARAPLVLMPPDQKADKPSSDNAQNDGTASKDDSSN